MYAIMLRGNRFTLTIVATCLLLAGLFPLDAGANGFRNPPDGAAAAAMDGGKIAFIDDPTAVTHNPANLADADKAAVAAPLTILYSWSEFDSPLGASDETEDKLKILPSLYGVYPFANGEWTFGLGLSVPYGQSTEWEEDSSFRYFAPYLAELTVVDISPTVATRLNDRVSAGVGLDIYYSELDFRQAVPWSTVVGAPVPDGKIRLEGDGEALGAHVGVTFNLTEKQRLALTYRSPFDIEYEGDTSLSGVPGPGPISPDSDFESEIKFPSVVVIGYGIELSEQLRVGADVEWVEFSRVDELPLDFGANDAAIKGSGLSGDAIPQDWDDIWTAGFGAQWKQSDSLVFRGGYKYMESPIPDSTHSPTLPDGDRHLLSVGSGYVRDSHRFDLAYAYNIIEDRDIRSSPVPPFNGDYEIHSHIFTLTYGYTF